MSLEELILVIRQRLLDAAAQDNGTELKRISATLDLILDIVWQQKGACAIGDILDWMGYCVDHVSLKGWEKDLPTEEQISNAFA